MIFGNRKLYNLKETAEALGINYVTLWGWLKDDKIEKPKAHVGRRKYYTGQQLEKMVNSIGK